MAKTFDPHEEEQLDQLKRFWGQYGTLITWLLVAVLLAFAGWNGWNYWQRQQAVEAAVLYQTLDEAAGANDTERVRQVWADIQQQVPRTAQAHHAGLLAARALQQADALDDARLALHFVRDNAADPGVVAAARLRLAALELQAGQYEAALQALGADMPPEFAALAADRRGDVLLAQGQTDAARPAYQQAWAAMDEAVDYRRVIEAKLNALGVDPTAPATPPAPVPAAAEVNPAASAAPATPVAPQ